MGKTTKGYCDRYIIMSSFCWHNIKVVKYYLKPAADLDCLKKLQGEKNEI
jgi:hypothetical protein